jgi:nifR3 family TIM-barrel protein
MAITAESSEQHVHVRREGEAGSRAALTDAWMLGGVPIANRVVLAPLAGIGNWFVRLQAKRYGAGLVVSEMVSSFAVHHRNERTCRELLRIHPDEHPVSVQLFGHDPEVMASAAERVAQAGADLIDLNMGCPVPKVCKTGAGAALLADPDRAVALARAAARGSGLPVTVKLRSGARPGDRSGELLAYRLVDEAGVAGLCIHPRHASQRHAGAPDYDLARRLIEALPVPVLISGGMRSAERTREAFERTGAAAVLLARGSLGNPWLFEQLLGASTGEPTRDEILAELHWVIDGACEHLGVERATRYLRKFYPWYVERLGGDRALQNALQRAPTLEVARLLLASTTGADETPSRYAPPAVRVGCLPGPVTL